MTYKNPNIEALIAEIRNNYDNDAYRGLPGKPSLDATLGTRLRELWNGTDNPDDLCIHNMAEYMRAHVGLSEDEFYSMLLDLRDALKEEFNKLKENP